MKTGVPVGKTEQALQTVREMYFENTSASPQLVAVYDGVDVPRPTVLLRGRKVERFEKGICTVSIGLLTIKARECRGDFKEPFSEERSDILKTWEPRTWLHALADLVDRGWSAELQKIFSLGLLNKLDVRGGRASNKRIDKDTGKLPSPAVLDCLITDEFPARLRVLVSDRAGGPYRIIEDEKSLLELAEKLEKVHGFWKTLLFPVNLDNREAKAHGPTASAVEKPVFTGTPGLNGSTQPNVRPQPWRDPGEPAEFLRLKFELLKLMRAGMEPEVISLLAANPELCATKLPPTGDCVLISAITHKLHRVIKYLLSRPDVDVNRRNEHGVTPLLKAASINNFNLIKMLVAKKADVNAVNDMGANVIYEAAFAAGHDAYFIIKYFHEVWKIPCDQQITDGFCALSQAIWRKCDEKTIRYLIEHTLDLNLEDFYGETPFYKAVKYGYFAAVNLLIDLGGDRLRRHEIPSGDLTKRASELFRTVSTGDLRRVKQLLDEGNDDVDEAEAEFGRSPLHEAVDRGHLQIVKVLIQYGANVFVQNNHGRIPRDFLPSDRDSVSEQIENVLVAEEKKWIETEWNKLRQAGGSRSAAF